MKIRKTQEQKMTILREALNQKLNTTQSQNQIAKNIGVSHTYVDNKCRRLKKLDLTWDDIKKLNDAELDLFFKGRKQFVTTKRKPDMYFIHQKMQIPYMTLLQCHQMYRLENTGDAYGYTQFCEFYKEYVDSIDVSMRQVHYPSEVVYCDFAGQTMSYKDKKTGEKYDVEVFVAVLGYSKLVFAYAVNSQKTEDWIACFNALFLNLGCVPQIIVCDNLKAAVIKPGLDPILNKAFLELAEHYGVTIIPARVGKPKDKALAESGVLWTENNAIAPLHHHQFFSLADINKALLEKITIFNEKPFQHYPGCRRTRYEEDEKHLMKSMPAEPYVYAEFTTYLKVSKEHYIMVDGNFYSVPYRLVGKKVFARYTQDKVEIMHLNQCVATHVRNTQKGNTITDINHLMPKHRTLAEHTKENILEWAENIGPFTSCFVEAQFEIKKHEKAALEACGKLKQITKSLDNNRIESISKYAVQDSKLITVKNFKSIKSSKIDLDNHQNQPIQINLPMHHNIRGADYYTRKEI